MGWRPSLDVLRSREVGMELAHDARTLTTRRAYLILHIPVAWISRAAILSYSGV